MVVPGSPDGPARRGTRVVLDANALMLPFQFRLNLDAELARLLGACEVFVPSSVVRELERLSEKDRKAKGALRLAAKYATLPTEARGDRAVVFAAKELGATVVTSDAALLKVLRREGIPRITFRSRSHLVIED